MANTVFEIVTYTVQQAEQAELGRQAAIASVQTYPGFVGWTRFAGGKNGGQFVDIVEWKSMEEALAAQTCFMEDPATEAFRAVFGEVNSMVHLQRVD